MPVKLVADSGSTKCEWCLITDNKKKKIITQGISPYFLTEEQVINILQKELLGKIKNVQVDEIFYYGTGLGSSDNAKFIKSRGLIAISHRSPYFLRRTEVTIWLKILLKMD